MTKPQTLKKYKKGLTPASTHYHAKIHERRQVLVAYIGTDTAQEVSARLNTEGLFARKLDVLFY